MNARSTASMPIINIPYEPFVEEEPTKDCWLEMGYDLTACGSYHMAIRAFDKVLQIDPSNDTAWMGKAIVFEAIGKHDESLKAHSKVIELNPDDPYSWRAKARALRALGRVSEADAADAHARDLGYVDQLHLALKVCRRL